jgi:hypothetical protein
VFDPDDSCGAVGGRVTGEPEPSPGPLCPSQNPNGLISTPMPNVTSGLERNTQRYGNANLILSNARFDVTMKSAEDFRFLGYENPVCTSQETHYVSATEPSLLKLCNI